MAKLFGRKADEQGARAAGERAELQADKDRHDALIGRLDSWFGLLEEYRTSESDHLTDELLDRVGIAPLPVANSPQETRHTKFVIERSTGLSYGRNRARGESTRATLEIRNARVAGNSTAAAEFENPAKFWTSVETYLGRL